MSSPTTPKVPGVELIQDSESANNVTPENSQNFYGEGTESFITPIKFPNKRLNELKGLELEGSRSPALKVPASPLMKRLGYGTGNLIRNTTYTIHIGMS